MNKFNIRNLISTSLPWLVCIGIAIILAVDELTLTRFIKIPFWPYGRGNSIWQSLSADGLFLGDCFMVFGGLLMINYLYNKKINRIYYFICLSFHLTMFTYFVANFINDVYFTRFLEKTFYYNYNHGNIDIYSSSLELEEYLEKHPNPSFIQALLKVLSDEFYFLGIIPIILSFILVRYSKRKCYSKNVIPEVSANNNIKGET